MGGLYEYGFMSSAASLLILLFPGSALSLPSPEDTPEEILRTEVILEARSPIDGQPLTAAEYAELQARLQTRLAPPKLNPSVRDRVFLLRLRQLFRTFVPFLPI